MNLSMEEVNKKLNELETIKINNKELMEEKERLKIIVTGKLEVERENEELREKDVNQMAIIKNLREENRGLKVQIEEKNNSIEKFGESAAEEYLKTEKIVSELREKIERLKKDIEFKDKCFCEQVEIVKNLEKEKNSLTSQYEEAKYYIEKKENEINILNKKLEQSELLGKMVKRLVEGL